MAVNPARLVPARLPGLVPVTVPFPAQRKHLLSSFGVDFRVKTFQVELKRGRVAGPCHRVAPPLPLVMPLHSSVAQL